MKVINKNIDAKKVNKLNPAVSQNITKTKKPSRPKNPVILFRNICFFKKIENRNKIKKIAGTIPKNQKKL